MRGESQDLPRILQALAGETHIHLALAGDILEAAPVYDACVWKVIPFQSTACDQGTGHGVVGDHRFRARHPEHGLQRFDVV